MKKSTLIASCLLNSSMVTNLEVGEQIVRNVFDENFQGQDFSQWDTSLPDTTARSIIAGVGRAMRINVRNFISDLESDPDQTNPDQHSSSDEAERAAKPGAEPVPITTAEMKFNGRT